MNFDLRQLEACALRLDERVQNNNGFEQIPTASECVESRLQQWREAVAPDNKKDFENRLVWQGWDLNKAKAFLHDYYPVTDSPPAPWTAVVSEIIQSVSTYATNPEQRAALEKLKDPDAPFPFEEILLPVLAVARRRLAVALEGHPASELLHNQTENASQALERTLLQILCERSGQVLAHELAERSLGAQLFSNSPLSGDVRYKNFVKELCSDGLCKLFQSYPALARLLAEGIELWVTAQTRFFKRLAEDTDAIYKHFGKPPDRIINYCAGLSDPHHGNQTVQALRFASGLELVYKPRNLNVEQAFGDFLLWCRTRGFKIELRVPARLCRENYGWVEFIETRPLSTEVEIPQLFERCGALACLLYTLRATDFHDENLIASGADLVPVDMEALLHADPSPLGSEETVERSSNAVLKGYLGSVLRSRLLPHWTFDKDQSYDYSGMGSLHPENVYREYGWSNLGSDGLHFGPIDHDLTKRPPRWSLNGSSVDPSKHIADIVRGFERCYTFLLEVRSELLVKNGPLDLFKGLQQRYIFRETRIYWRILRSSFTPAALRSGLDRSFAIDRLSRAYLYPDKPKCFALLAMERNAIECGDIPYFSCLSDELTISNGDEQPIIGVFRRSAFDGLCAQLQQLSETDLYNQRNLVEASFTTVQLRTPGSTTNPVLLTEPDAAQFMEPPPLSQEDCLRYGLQIADRLQKRAIIGNDGSAGWISPRIHSGSDKYLLHPLPPGLYSGLDGAAILLAAADAVRGNTENKSLVRKLFFPLFAVDVREVLERRPLNGLGLNNGYGSLLYSLCLIGQLYGDEAFFDRALAILDLLDPGEIDADTRLDLLGGSSGLLLALSALNTITGKNEPLALELAIRCGDQLLSRQQSIDGKPAAWKTLEECPLPLTGLSHGAAGIALSLAKLATWSQQSRFMQAAHEGIAYERAVFDTNRCNWPDYRSIGNNGQVAWMSSWCHGATGIGMARLACAPLLEKDETLDAEIKFALASSQMHFGRLDLDHICCGNFGRIELRLLAGTQQSSPDLLRSAYQGAAQLVGRSEQCQGFVLFKGIPGHIFDPQFFQGQAGIGYQFLRLARPELLPSVAIFAGIP